MINSCFKIAKKDQALINYNLIASANVGILNGSFSCLQIQANMPNLHILMTKLPNYQNLWQSDKINQNLETNILTQSYSNDFGEAWYLLSLNAIRDYSALVAYSLLPKQEYFSGNYNQLKKITNNIINPIYLKVFSKSLVTKMQQKNPIFANHKFTNKEVIHWIQVHEINQNQKMYLPAQLFFNHFPVKKFGEYQFFNYANSGIGFGCNQTKALENALISAMQAHVFMKSWYFNNKTFELIINNQLLMREIKTLTADLSDIKIEFHYYPDSESPLFHIGCYLINETQKFPAISFGLSSGINIKQTVISALKRALNTYVFNCYQLIKHSKEKTLSPKKVWYDDLVKNLILFANPKYLDKNYLKIQNRISQKIKYSDIIQPKLAINNNLVHNIIQKLKCKNYDILVMDITAPEIKDYYSVVKVFIPQFLPLMFPSMPYDQHPGFKNNDHQYDIHPCGVIIDH